MALSSKSSQFPVTYSQTLKHLYNLKKFGIRLGLEEFNALLERLNNPQKGLKSVLVGGTNGKGSTSAMISSILRESGYRVGLYTSPHLERLTERIKINDIEIPQDEMVRLFRQIKDAVDSLSLETTFFEFLTAMALLYFREMKVDIAVLEVGMGGRLDATNVVKPLVSVITNVSKEHEEYLGKGLLEIAKEKAGTVKEDSVLVAGVQDGEVLNFYEKLCKRKGSDLKILGRDFCIREDGGFTYLGDICNIMDLKTNLRGIHQHKNAALSIAALEVLNKRGFVMDEEAIKRGLEKVQWPGRLEFVTLKGAKGRVILDCAHNPAAMKTLKRFLIKEIGFKRLILILGIMKDKDIKGILSIIAPMAGCIIVTSPDEERAASPDLLLREVSRYNPNGEASDSVEEACQKGLSILEDGDMMCVTGSIFTVGEARRFLLKDKQ